MVTEATGKSDRKISVYQKWMQSIGVPIYEGHFVEDLRSVELGWWEERQVNTAFLLLMPDEAYTDPTFEWDYGDDD